MTRRFGDNRQERFGDRRFRVVGVVLALSLLTMPVSYRAGTAFSHPHAFVQFLTDASAGTLDHHTKGKDVHQAAETTAEQPAIVSSAPVSVPTLDASGPGHERASALGLALLVTLLALVGGRTGIVDARTRPAGLAIRPPSPPPRPAAGLLV